MQTGAASTTPPMIRLNGDNPAIIHVGDTYTDLGATINPTKVMDWVIDNIDQSRLV
jgi:hypothetical protein